MLSPTLRADRRPPSSSVRLSTGKRRVFVQQRQHNYNNNNNNILLLSLLSLSLYVRFLCTRVGGVYEKLYYIIIQTARFVFHPAGHTDTIT